MWPICIRIYNQYIYIHTYIHERRQNPLHLSSCYCYGYRFCFVEINIFEIQHEWSQNHPKSIPKQARKWIHDWGVVLLVSGASATLHVPSFCIHLPFIVYSFPLTFLSFSFHVPFICINFPVFSFHIPFIFISMCIHVLSFSFHFLSFCIHVLSFHFKSYGNGSMAWPGDRVQQIVIAIVIAK